MLVQAPSKAGNRSLARDLAMAAAVVPAATAVLFSIRYENLFHSIGNNPILSFAIAGAFVIHVCGAKSLAPVQRAAEIGFTLALAIALRFAYRQLAGGFDTYDYWSVIHWGSFLGIASLIVMGVQAALTDGERRRSLASDLTAGGGFFFYWILIGIALSLTVPLIRRTYDSYLYAFDGSLGFQPSFLCGQWLRRQASWAGLVAALYYAIPLPVALLYAAQRLRGYAAGYKIFPLLIAASAGGYLLYYFLPGTGPIYEFAGEFPFDMPAVALGSVQPHSDAYRAVRNAMPSLHLGTALMVAWNCRIWPRTGRVLVWLFFGITAFATLAIGQHYLVDLVVAFPLMLAFHAAGLNSIPIGAPARLLPIVSGFAATFGWLALLRYGAGIWLHSTALAWVLVVTTVAGSCIFELRLARFLRTRT